MIIITILGNANASARLGHWSVLMHCYLASGLDLVSLLLVLIEGDGLCGRAALLLWTQAQGETQQVPECIAQLAACCFGYTFSKLHVILVKPVQGCLHRWADEQLQAGLSIMACCL